MAFSPPPYPWDPISLPSPNVDFNSPGDLVVQLINFHFQVKATRIIFETLPNESAYIPDTIPLKDSSFARIIKTIGQISQHCMNSTVSALCFWRQTMNPYAEFSEVVGEKTPRASMMKSNAKPRSIEDINQGERQGLIVDYIFTELLKRVLMHYNGDNVSEKTMDSLEETIFKFFITVPNSKTDVSLKNREFIRNSFRFIIKLIGRFRIGSILAKFFTNYTINLKSPAPAIVLMDGLHEVIVNHRKTDEVQAACGVIATVDSNLKSWVLKVKKVEQKLGFCIFLGGILSAMSRVPLQGISRDLQGHASSLMDSIEVTLKKSKNKHNYLLPLAASVLCVCDHAIFYSKFDFILENLLNQHKGEPILRTACLEALYNLIYASMTKFEDKNEARRQKIRGLVATNLCPSKDSKKTQSIPMEIEQIDIVIDIIELLSLIDVESVVASLVMPFFQLNQPLAPEMLIIGVYSLLRIFKRHGGFVLTNLYPHFLSHLIDDPKTRHRKQTLKEILDLKKAEIRQIGDSHLSIFSQYLSQAMAALHQTVGNYTKVTDSVKAIDSIPKEKLLSAYAMEATIAGIQMVIPSSIHTSELFTYITRYTLHIYPGVEMNSVQVLKQVIVRRSSFRFLISHCLYKLIFSIPDTMHEAIRLYAHNLLEILRAWYHQRENNSEFKENSNDYDGQVSISEPNFNQLDALAIYFLCSPSLDTQSLGYEIIKTTKKISEFYPNHNFTDFYSIIINHSAEAITLSYLSKSHFGVTNIPPRIPNFEEILQTKDQNDTTRFRYSKIIAKLFNYMIIDGLTETVKSFIKIVKDRVVSAQFAVEHQNSSENIVNANNINNHTKSEKLVLWRNYISVLCACCEVFDSTSEFNSPDQEVVETSRDLFKLILPHIRSEVIDRRNASESAISFTLPSVSSSLLMELSSYEKIAFNDDKAKPKLKMTNSIIISYIYRIILEILSNSFSLMDNSKVSLKQIMTTLKHQIERIPEAAAPTDNTLDIQFWRYNVCISLKFLFEEINRVKLLDCKDEYGKDFFDLCFAFLTKCSGYGDTPSSTPELQKIKDRRSLLAFIKDRDDKESMKSTFEDQANALQSIACDALIPLCYGPCDEEELKRKLIWIGNVFASGTKDHQECGRKALINVLRSNKERRAYLFSAIIDECYNGDPNRGMQNFMVISELYQFGKIPLYPSVLLTLALHNLCNNNYDIRQLAVKFLKAVCKKRFPGNYSFVESATIYDTYQSNQELLASQIAKNHPSISVDFIEETLIRFRLMDDTARERLLKITQPFLYNIALSKLQQTQCCGLLETLCIITYKYGEQFTTTIEKIWSSLATSPENVVVILNYLISFSALRRNNNILVVGEKVTLLLSRILPQDVIFKLIYELFSTDRIGRTLSDDEYREFCESEMEAQSKIKPSWAKDAVFLFPTVLKIKPFSRSNIAVIFLQGIILEKIDSIKGFIPMIFITMILAMDMGNDRLRLAYKSIINNLFFHISNLPDGSLEVEYKKIIEFIDKGWEKADFMNATFERDNRFSQFLNLLLSFVKPLTGDITYQVMMCSLKWAHISNSSHLVCRSLQIYRHLHQPINKDSLFYLLSILNTHLKNRNPKSNRNIMHEVLLSLQSAAEISTCQVILNHPEIWNTTLISLHTDNEKEYALAIDLLATLLGNLNFNDPLVVEKLANPLTLKDAHIASGVQPIILKGLTSEDTEEVSRTLLSEFLTIQCDKLIDPSPTRHLDNIIALLPYILSNIISDDKEVIENVIVVASNMADLFQQLKHPEISVVLKQFAQGEYEDAASFLLEFNKPFYQHFVKGNEIRVFSALFYNILYGSKKYKTSTFLVFEAFMSLVDIANTPIQKQMMGMYYQLLELLESDKWTDLIGLLDVTVENSLAVDKYEFTILPNPSVIAKIFDKIEAVRSPWSSSDNNKPLMLSLLNDVIKTLTDPNFFDLEDFGKLVKERSPLIDDHSLVYSHSETTSSNVLRQNKTLKFADDRKKSKKNILPGDLPEFDNPMKQIYIPAPNLVESKITSFRLSKFTSSARIENSANIIIQ